MTAFLLLILGLCIGTFGTLIGVGGGFILVPTLLLMYPNQPPQTITAISLSVVFFNALSGTIAYSKLKRIDIRSGFLFSLATVPGSILGAWTVHLISRNMFNFIFAILLLVLAVVLFIQPESSKDDATDIPTKHIIRRIIDADSTEYVYGYHPWLGVGISLIVGFTSSLLGIGGGIIHVPALVHLLNFPVHIATATSNFVLSFTAMSGSMVHLFSGELTPVLSQIFPLSIGAIAGAQIGARLSKRIHGSYIIRLLSIALGLVGFRILLTAFQNC